MLVLLKRTVQQWEKIRLVPVKQVFSLGLGVRMKAAKMKT